MYHINQIYYIIVFNYYFTARRATLQWMFRKLELITDPAENSALFNAYMCRLFGPQDSFVRDAVRGGSGEDHREEGKPELNISPHAAKLKKSCKRKRSNI